MVGAGGVDALYAASRRRPSGYLPSLIPALIAALVSATLLVACTSPEATQPAAPAARSAAPPSRPPTPPAQAAAERSVVTLAFAGDVHFQLNAAQLLKSPRAGLGAVDRTLEGADLTMVNLESAVTERGSPDPKELEAPDERYWFRASPAALDVLGAAGVDVVTMANNHGADYGAVGLRDTLRAARSSPVAVLGVGQDRAAAFAAYRTTVRGTDIAVLAADGSPREGSSSVWAAGPSTPGIAAARNTRPEVLLDKVREARRRDELVVVYLHWGRDQQRCPTAHQRATAQALAAAGADVVVGSHAHVQLGSGWMGDTYVSYGLGNFVWYHDRQPETGVLRLRIANGEVVADRWVPARIHRWGSPLPLDGRARADAVADWRALRGCAGLAARPGGRTAARPDPGSGAS